MSVGLREPREVHTIEEMRQEHVDGRIAALDQLDHIHLSRAETGTGKTHSDTAVIVHPKMAGRRSLTLVPDHKHSREIATMRADAGVNSVAFPQLCEETCLRYDEARAVIAIGLSATAALCPNCELREDCEYRVQHDEAKNALHTIATHARAKVTPELYLKRKYISIHENPLDMLRPNYMVNGGLKKVADVAEQASYTATDARDRGFYRHMESVARKLHGEFQGSNEPCAVALPEPSQYEPEDLHAALYSAVVEGECKAPPPEGMKLVLAAVLGKLDSIDVSINEIRGKGGEVGLVRSITAVGKTELPLGSTIIFSDATADIEEYQAILGRPVRDITPCGRLERKHPVLQIIPKQLDVTRKANVVRVAEIVQGLLHDIPHRRLGLITHRTLHERVVKWLGKNTSTDTSRLTKVSYFGAQSRGSNEWIGCCDALLIIGTPRVPPSSIRRHLLLLGKREASRLTAAEADWHDEPWTGRTESGAETVVDTRRYRNPDWHAAYLSLVRSELKQAIGRGRSLLPNGIPVFAVTTECLGDIPIADHPYARLTQRQAGVLNVLMGTDGLSKERTLKTETIGQRIGVKKDRAYKILAQLEQDGRVKRRGDRGGWFLAPPPDTYRLLRDIT
jgi:hypothetical protein